MYLFSRHNYILYFTYCT